MADPFTIGTMAVVGAAASAVGGGVTAYGQAQSGAAGSAMYKYKAGVAARNAVINRQNSDYALEVGETQSVRSGLTTGFNIGKQKVVQAANGFDVNSGSNAAVRDSTRDIGVTDQTTIRTNAGRKALGFRQRAADLDAEGGADIMAGDNAIKAGEIAATGTLIGTAGSVASKWTQASQVWGGGGSGVTLYGPEQQVTGFMK